MDHDEAKLPRWARERLESLRRDLDHLGGRFDRLQTAYGVLTNREWFAVHGPPEDLKGRPFYHLWFLCCDDPRQACSLAPGDVLLVGRKGEKA